MNINQKIQFLRNRRHMDAMRIKRLKRRFSDVSMSKSFFEARALASKIANFHCRSFKSRFGRKTVDTDWHFRNAGVMAFDILNDILKHQAVFQSYEMAMQLYHDIKRNLKISIKEIKDSVDAPESKEKYIGELNTLYQLVAEAELSARIALKSR